VDRDGLKHPGRRVYSYQWDEMFCRRRWITELLRGMQRPSEGVVEPFGAKTPLRMF
jgi:hypothetical protein